MSIEMIPDWMANLDDEDITFIKNYLLESGSLKELSRYYEVSLPTVQLRLDQLIQKININKNPSNDSYISLVKKLAINDKIDFDTAKILISEYRNLLKKVKKT